MKKKDSLIDILRWTYARSSFYRDFYDSIHFSTENYIETGCCTDLPVIELKEFLGSSFFDLLTMPLSAVAETYIVKHKECEILLARSAQECEQSIESAKKFLTATGINRTSSNVSPSIFTRSAINDINFLFYKVLNQLLHANLLIILHIAKSTLHFYRNLVYCHEENNRFCQESTV